MHSWCIVLNFIGLVYYTVNGIRQSLVNVYLFFLFVILIVFLHLSKQNNFLFLMGEKIKQLSFGNERNECVLRIFCLFFVLIIYDYCSQL